MQQIPKSHVLTRILIEIQENYQNVNLQAFATLDL